MGKRWTHDLVTLFHECIPGPYLNKSLTYAGGLSLAQVELGSPT